MTLDAVAARTKISVFLLEGLERDDVSHWPGGIFRRSYIRDYAKAIGLPPETVLAEFLERHPAPDDGSVAELAAAAQADGGSHRGRSSAWLRTQAEGVLGALARARDQLTTRRSAMPVAPAVPVASTGVPARPLEWAALARLCTRLAQVDALAGTKPLLREVTAVLDAVGVIVWVWDARGSTLQPAATHGYADAVVAQLPRVQPEADHATARAFRLGKRCAVGATERASGALVVPLITPAGCVGVLAWEFAAGSRQPESSDAAAAILAAQFARLLGATEARKRSGPRDQAGATAEKDRYLATAGWPSQSSNRISPSSASLPGTSVRLSTSTP